MLFNVLLCWDKSSKNPEGAKNEQVPLNGTCSFYSCAEGLLTVWNP